MIERSIIITENIKQSGSTQMSTAQIELYTDEYVALPEKWELPPSSYILSLWLNIADKLIRTRYCINKSNFPLVSKHKLYYTQIILKITHLPS